MDGTVHAGNSIIGIPIRVNPFLAVSSGATAKVIDRYKRDTDGGGASRKPCFSAQRFGVKFGSANVADTT